MTQADHISVMHGSMMIDVPRKIFKGKNCDIDKDEADKFMELICARYPWISVNAFNVLMNKARMEMMRVRDEETNGREYSKVLAEKGDLDKAIEHLKIRLDLNPEDAKTWYELGELLFKKGDSKGGFEAFHKADSLYKKK